MATLRIEPLATHADHVDAAALLARVWGETPRTSPFPADLIRALAHAGACALGAWQEPGQLVGVTIAAAGGPRSDALYSLIAGVAPEAAGAGVGRRLKFAQRDWARERGARSIRWTYDPLIRRNAHFNLDRLGADVTAYLEDYYPPMTDAINVGDLTDRFLVDWEVAPDSSPDPSSARSPGSSPAGGDDAQAPVALAAGAAGEPVVRKVRSSAVRVWIPEDIEAMRQRDRTLAMRWRLASREVFRTLFDAGYRPVRTDPEGHYVFTPTGPEES